MGIQSLALRHSFLSCVIIMKKAPPISLDDGFPMLKIRTIPSDFDEQINSSEPFSPLQDVPEKNPHNLRLVTELPEEDESILRFDGSHLDSETSAGKSTLQYGEINHRESQLNARIAQFETLVRNTQLMFKEKMNALAERESEVGQLQAAFQQEKKYLESERLEFQIRKTEMEEHLAHREKEMIQIAIQRENEWNNSLELYRADLERQLQQYIEEYKQRYTQKSEELRRKYETALQDDRNQLDAREQEIVAEYTARIKKQEEELQAKKKDLQKEFLCKQEEWERQLTGRAREMEENLQRRVKDADAELLSRREESDARLARREQQIKQRETIIREAESEWAQRRETFEKQWAEYEQLRQEKLHQFAEAEAQLDERQHLLSGWETRLKAKESDLTHQEESVKVREKQVEIDAEKFKRIREIEEEVLQSQSESTRMREGLVRERHQLQKMIEADRQRYKESHDLAARRLEEERIELATQNKKMEQMRITLERSREELGRMHRETLEIRLATEELWLRLADDAAPEDLKESVTRIRARLADQYRDALTHVEGQKDELKSLRQQLLLRQEKLLQSRDELNHWATQCEDALLEKEKQLQAREEELDRQQASVYETLRRQRNIQSIVK